MRLSLNILTFDKRKNMRSRSIYSACIWIALAFLSSCAYNDINKLVDCSKVEFAFALDGKINPTQCLSIDGSITVSASGEDAPYSFSIDGGGFQTNNLFDKLGPGLYSIIAKSSKGCEKSIEVELTAANTTLTASFSSKSDTECFAHNGSIQVTALQGKPPYMFQFGQSSFKKSTAGDTTINNLKAGSYIVTVKDSEGCPKVLSVKVPRGNTGISYAGVIKPILDTNCNVTSCHNGDLGGSRDWRTYSTVKANATNIKTRTTNKSMPTGGITLTQQEIDQIACWVDDGAPNN
jgi:SprB repeat